MKPNNLLGSKKGTRNFFIQTKRGAVTFTGILASVEVTCSARRKKMSWTDVGFLLVHMDGLYIYIYIPFINTIVYMLMDLKKDFNRVRRLQKIVILLNLFYI